MISVTADAVPNSHDLVDATWVMPGRTEPLDGYLHRTTHSVDTDAIKSLPIGDRVAKAADVFGQSGLNGSRAVAIYDRAGLFSAPWIWWLLRSHGCDAALIEGWGDTTKEFPIPAPTDFQYKGDPDSMNATRDDVLAAVGTQVQIIDARPAARFSGEAEEPRAECRAGHIPGSLNIPFSTLKSGRHFHVADTLKSLFADKGVDLSRPIITSCGSGVTASGLAFALTRCGAEHVQVYQGSWAEWGVDPDCPIETGS